MIEPRNAYFEKDDTLGMVEVNTGISANGKEISASSGSESMACLVAPVKTGATKHAILRKHVVNNMKQNERGGLMALCCVDRWRLPE